MKTRILLLASFLVLGVGCGNKTDKAGTPGAPPLGREHVEEAGAERITAQEFLRKRPKLVKVESSSLQSLQTFKLTIQRGGYFELRARSVNGSRSFEYGRIGGVYGKVTLAQFGEALPYRRADGTICANVYLTQVSYRPSMNVKVCERNFSSNDGSDEYDDYDDEDEDYDQRDNRRRGRRW